MVTNRVATTPFELRGIKLRVQTIQDNSTAKREGKLKPIPSPTHLVSPGVVYQIHLSKEQ